MADLIIDIKLYFNPEGMKALPEVILYDDINFKEFLLRTHVNYSEMGHLENRCSSILVVSGIWEFYDNEHYAGLIGRLTPGYYPDIRKSILNKHNNISSLRCVGFTV